jgi:uncharacterized protein
MQITLRHLLLVFCCSFVSATIAQDYATEMANFREKYKKEFLTNENSPLTKEDLPFLHFYEADKKYKVLATFRRTENETIFDMPTHSGKMKQYIKYGEATFLLKGETFTLCIYQSVALRQQSKYKDHLFLPFKDVTNNVTTYGGGRYLDFKLGDIQQGQIEIDFNKCYNPYCAYKEGYACPVPPFVNHLKARIEAGEKKFEKE